MALKPFNGEFEPASSGNKPKKLKPFTGEAPLSSEPTPRSGMLRRTVGDSAVTALKSAIAVPELAVGLADLASGGRAGKALEGAGFRPKEAKSILDGMYSPEQQAANARVAEADGFIGTGKAMLDNPSTIAHTVGESIAPMLAGGVLARGLGAVSKAPAWVRGAAGEGIVSAGMAAEGVRQQTDDGLLTAEQSLLAGGSGLATGLIGAGGAKLAQRLGIGEVDTLLAGGADAAQASSKGVARKVAEGAVVEGVLQEAPQSAQEQVAQNLALDHPAGEGVGSALAAGMLAGGVIGGAVGPMGGAPKVQPIPTAENPAPLPVEAPDPDAGVLSRAANQLPTATPEAEAMLALPAPNTLYGDRQGVIQDAAPARNDLLPRAERAQPGLDGVIPSGQQPNQIPAEEVRRQDRVKVAALEQERSDRQAQAFVNRVNVEAREALRLREESGEAGPQFTMPPGLDLADKQGYTRWMGEPYRNSVQGLVSQLTKGGDVAYVRNENGVITRRTASVNPKWWQDMDPSVKPGSVEQAKTVVEKALAGKSLGPKQARFIATMMDMTDDMRVDPQQAEQNEAILQEIEREINLESRRNNVDNQIGGRQFDLETQDESELYAYLDGKVEPFSLDELTPEDIDSIRRDLIALDDTTEQTRMAGDNSEGEDNADYTGTIQARGQVPAQQGLSGNRDGDSQDGQAVPAGRQPDGFDLESQTEEQLASQERARAEAEQADTAARTQEEQRIRADSERNDFSLTGSNRTADVGAAAGQTDLLSTATTEPVTSPAVTTERDADQIPSIQGADIDGDWAQFSAESGTLGIPRADMPQIKAEHRGAMVNFLKARGVRHTESTVPAASLKPTQAEFSRKKVEAAKSYDGGDRAILVSRDGHVLDGHHQWMARREGGEDVRVIRLSRNINNLLAAVRKFPSAGMEQAPAAESIPEKTAVFAQDEADAIVADMLAIEREGGTIADQLAALYDSALSAMIDEIAGEVAAPQTSKPKAQRSTKAKTAAGKPRIRKTATKAERTDLSNDAEVSRTAGEIAKSLGGNLGGASMSALEGLTKLFGGPGRLNSGLSFDKETYEKAKPHFQAVMKDLQAAGKDVRDLIRALVGAFGDGVKPYILQFAKDIQQEQGNGRTNSNLESDSAADAERAASPDLLNQESGEGGQRAGRMGAQEDGQGRDTDAGVSGDSAATDRESGDRALGGAQSGVVAGDARSLNTGGSRASGTGGLYAERDADPAADRAIEAAKQLSRSKAEVKPSSAPGTLAEIKRQMPFLTDGQAQDVVFAEKRLSKPDGYGVLYTNGTGTGKTFSGLGIAARMDANGKNNILVAVPKQPIADAWVKAGKRFFGLDIKQLADTRDNGGSGIVVTTYANLSANPSLAQRQWDAVIADEAQYLSSAEDGGTTKALQNLRALTRRRGSEFDLVAMKHADLIAERNRLQAEAKSNRMSDDMRNWPEGERQQAEADRLTNQISGYQNQERAAIAAMKPQDKPRGVFLSATPFAYEKNVQWAQEFLFDWGKDDDGTYGAYNSGGKFEQFMMQHFGYRMRYNKLTEPEAEVDRGLMQRAFNTFLKREGALSGRALDSQFDYDRLFVTVDSPIGRRVDEALTWLREQPSADGLSDNEKDAFRELNDKIAKDSFNYHARMYFLEAIKAREAIPHIKAQLAAGRKVLVMHDFKKGGVINPFRISPNGPPLKAAYAVFSDTFPDLIRAFDYLPSPISQMTATFPQALVYNGDVSSKKRIAMQDVFNSDDDQSPKIMIAQGDAMREGVSIHDTTGKYPRVLVHLGMPVKPTASIQQEGRIYRTGQASDAMFRYFTIGTSWERSAFATKIAGRAGAAENLAMGEQARGLKQAFINAYENADIYEPGFESEGQGGKAADQAAAAALTPWDMAKSFYFGTKKQGKGRSSKGREGVDYFATPEPVGLKMVEWADIRGNESVLEPSAGHGAIARWFPENSRVRIIEQSAELSSRAALHVDGDVVTGSFEDHNIVNKYDAIVMNPPYGSGGSTAINHLEKATLHLREGGRVVALIPTGPAADKKFENWLYGQDKNGKALRPDLHLVGDVTMPGVTFERAGTSVATRVVIIDKVSGEAAEAVPSTRRVDISREETIGQLFDRMETSEMPARTKAVEPEQAQTAPAKSVTPKGNFAEKRAAELGDDSLLQTDAPIVEHVTKKGKTLRGVIITDRDISWIKDNLDPYAFRKDGGVFVREQYIKKADSDGPVFSRGSAGASGFVSRGDVEQLAIRKMGKGTVSARFRFLDYAQLPPQIKDAAAAQGAKPAEIKAVHWRGITYLVDNRFATTDEAIGAMFHEHYVHFGLRAKYGRGLRLKLGKLLSGVGGLKGVRELAGKQGIDLSDYEDGLAQDASQSSQDRSLVLMEELMAHMGETTGTLRRIVEEFVGMVRAWLRDNGYADLSRLGVTDLAFELRGARQAAIAADRALAAESDQPMFQRERSDTADIRFRRTDPGLSDRAQDIIDRALGRAQADANDPFAEENRRLREDDKALWTKAKKVFQRQLTPGGLLPKSVFSEKITRDSEFQAVEFDVRHMVGTLDKAIKADYGVKTDELTEAQIKQLSDALAGKVDPALPENTKVAIVAMRQYIDTLSGEYLSIIQDQIIALQEKAATYGPALKAANDARKAVNAAIASSDNPAIRTAAEAKKAALSAQVRAKKAMTKAKGDQRAPAKAAYEAAVADHANAKRALRSALTPELRAELKRADALRSTANDARSSSAEARSEAALYEKIAGNVGAYVNRSYQAFDDAKWFQKVPTDTVNAARQYLINGYVEQGETAGEARRLADVTVNEILKNGTAYDSMGAFITEGKLGAKDLTILIKRKDIAPQIRALLGEYTDPRLNFAKSATKMGRLIWNQRFLDRVREMGMGAFLFEGKNRPADATTQIAGEQSDSYAPLNGLWTFPEVAQAFQDALGKEQMSDLYRTIVRANGMVKYGKTILSPTTAMRNWQSAMFFSLANGHFDLTQMRKSFAAFREQVAQTATGNDLTYLRKLKQLGVVYDTPYAGEMKRLMEDAQLEDMMTGKAGGRFGWFSRANEFAQGFYSFGDDFWKIIGFENEKAMLLNAGVASADADKMAAERIRNTYPTYSMVGKSVRWLARFPLAGTFVSFPAEIVRTTANMMKLTASDLKSDNPGLRAIGRKRAVGMAMVSGGFYALSAMAAAALGVDDEEEEAVRDLAAPWQTNSTFLFTGRDEDGKLRYFDLSFLDPYGYWKRPLTAMMRDQPWEDAAASGIADMVSPFFGADMVAESIFQVLANKKSSGGQVYLENGDPVDQLTSIADHMRKTLQPGFVSNAERLWLAGTETRRQGSGQPYVMQDEVVSLLGWRASTLDTRTALYYRSFEFTDALRDASKTVNRTVRSANTVSDKDIRESREAAQKQYEQAFIKMSRLISSARDAGMTDREIRQTLKLSNVSAINAGSLLRGTVPQMRIGAQSQARAIRQARIMQGEEQAREIARRFRVLRDQQ